MSSIHRMLFLAWIKVWIVKITPPQVLTPWERKFCGIFVGTDEKNDFCELWQQHKLLKTMEMSGFSLILTVRHIHINSNLNPLTKFTSSSRSTERYPPMEHLSNDHEDHPNQLKNSHAMKCDEVGHPVLSLLEGQWKLRQQLDQNFPLEGKPLLNKY